MVTTFTEFATFVTILFTVLLLGMLWMVLLPIHLMIYGMPIWIAFGIPLLSMGIVMRIGVNYLD